jgi:hypothetical protein
VGLLVGAAAGAGIALLVLQEPQPESPGGQTNQAEPTPPSPSPSPTTRPEFTTARLGETVPSAVGNRVTVFGWDTKVDWPEEPGPGLQLSRADVQVCRAEGAPPATTSDYAFLFALEMENGTRFAAEGTGFNGDELLVQDDPVAEGDCARGVVIFQSTAGERPVFVVFSSSSVIKWEV